MRLFRTTYRDRKGQKRQAKRWYVEWTDHQEVLRRWPAYEDKRSSSHFGRQLEKLAGFRRTREPLDEDLLTWLETLTAKALVKLEAIGLLDRRRSAAGKGLTEHIEDFKAALAAKGGTKLHVDTTVSRAETVAEGCSFVFWSDMDADAVRGYLADRRAKGTSAQTSNHLLQCFKQFCRWMVRAGRATRSPVADIERVNVAADRRLERRTLTVSELRLLLRAAAASEETVGGMPGPDRAMLYRVAVETGLRWNECHSLTRRSFDLDADLPTVSLEAGNSKRRRVDVLPLRPGTAEVLLDYLSAKTPNAKAFPMPKRRLGAAMVRADLKAVGNNPDGTSIIPEVDDAGRVLDFHSLRHTFVTNLANAGVHPKVAQTLARHSTITLTMDCYTHTLMEDQTEAVAALPDLGEPVTDAEPVRATGTEGADKRLTRGEEPTRALAAMLAQKGPEHARDSQDMTDKRSPERKNTSSSGNAENTVANDTSKAEGVGFEPTNELPHYWFSRPAP